MWHASAAFFRPHPKEKIEQWLRGMLKGVGQPETTWVEQGTKATHMRRLTTEREAHIIGPLRDIRDTPELDVRIAAVAETLDCKIETLRKVEFG